MELKVKEVILVLEVYLDLQGKWAFFNDDMKLG